MPGSASARAPSRPLPLVLLGLWLAAAGAVGGLVLAIEAWAVSGYGPWRTQGIELLALPALGALVIALVAAPFALARRHRRWAGATALGAAAFVLVFVVAVRAGSRVRTAGFARAAERARPVVAAVHAWVRETGAPPRALEDLVPRHLAALPDGLPPLRVVDTRDEREQYAGNAWILRADVPTGILNWDELLYFPNGRYPRTGYGGWLERVGEWAYVHE